MFPVPNDLSQVSLLVFIEVCNSSDDALVVTNQSLARLLSQYILSIFLKKGSTGSD